MSITGADIKINGLPTARSVELEAIVRRIWDLSKYQRMSQIKERHPWKVLVKVCVLKLRAFVRIQLGHHDSPLDRRTIASRHMIWLLRVANVEGRQSGHEDESMYAAHKV